MKKNGKTIVSAYVKGDDNTPEYYRIYQYLYKIDGINCKYHKMMSTWVYKHFMPVSRRPVLIKIFVYLHQYVRMLLALVSDNMNIPDVLIVHKRIISHYMPFSFNWMLNRLHRKGVKIIWDFDDHILKTKEISLDNFHLMSSISEKIVVTHRFLANLIDEEYQDKVTILPTTDGDMEPHVKRADLAEQRLLTLHDNIRLIWIGTSYNIPLLSNIVPQLEYAAITIKEKENRCLSITVVCDKPLNSRTKHLRIINIPWSRITAIEELKNAHIGIMPLPDSEFNRGKGGFKLVQYMAMALPCIGSDVGFNNKVIDSSCGFLLKDDNEVTWLNAITTISDSTSWRKFSEAAIRKWERDFSFERNLSFWTSSIKDNQSSNE